MENYPPDVIQQMLHFSVADLRENQADRLSGRQYARLTWIQRLYLLRCLAYGLSAFVAFVLLTFILNGLNDSLILNLVIGLVIFGALILISVKDLQSNWNKYQLLGKDLSQPRVQIHEGNASVRSESRGYGRDKRITFFIDVGAESFSISRVVFYPLKQETWCRVYYTPNAKFVVALERQRDLQ